MARGQTLAASFKGRKRTGDWTHSDHNQLVQDLERWSQTIPVAGFGFVVYRSTNDAAVANNADTPIIFTNVLRDYEGFTKVNASSFSSITVPPNGGGVYMLKGALRLTAAASGVYATIQVTRGGSVYAIGMAQMVSPMNQIQVMALDLLFPGDQIRLLTVNRSGAAVTPSGGIRSSNTELFPSLAAFRLNLPPARKTPS